MDERVDRGTAERRRTAEALEKLGMGPATAQALVEAGFTDILALAVASPKQLDEAAGIGLANAGKILAAARRAADVGNFEYGDGILARKRGAERLTTGSRALDELLGGGLETQCISEFFGGPGSGRTQVALSACITVGMPKDRGGLDGDAAFIDTGGAFSAERVAEVAESRGLDPLETLKRVHHVLASDSRHQMLLVDKTAELARERRIRLLVVDSLTAHFRAEFAGRGTLAERQQLLNRHLHDLLKFAQANNAVMVCTNERQDGPAKSTGGHIVRHAIARGGGYRVHMRKLSSKSPKRVARLIDSPNLPEGEAVFLIGPGGVGDLNHGP